jgi:hypothetical protein
MNVALFGIADPERPADPRIRHTAPIATNATTTDAAATNCQRFAPR